MLFFRYDPLHEYTLGLALSSRAWVRDWVLSLHLIDDPEQDAYMIQASTRRYTKV